MDDGGGRPRCGVDMLSSALTLTRSELIIGVSILGWGHTRDLGSGSRGEKSWVFLLPPNSVLVGCERVSNIDTTLMSGVACDNVQCKQCFCARGRQCEYKQ